MNPISKTPLWGSMSALWLLLIPVVTAIYMLLLPIAPNDFWYNVRAGAHIAATGKIPTTALFTTSVPPDTPYYYQAWLSQLLLFKTLEVGGLSGTVLLRAVCLTAAFSLIILTAWRRALRINAQRQEKLKMVVLARVVASAALLAFLLAASNMDVRPQMFSTLLGAFYLFLVFEWPFLAAPERRIAIASSAVGMALWANLHGAFILGVFLLAAVFIGSLLSTIPKRTHACALVLPQAGRLFFIAALATLLNPRGMELYFYAFQLVRDESSQRYIQEWQSPSFSQWYGALFYGVLASLFLLSGVLLWRWYRERIEIRGIYASELLGLALVILMALRDVRSIIWFGLFLPPVLAALIIALFPERRRKVLSLASARNSRVFSALNKTVALVLVALPLPFFPQFRAYLPLPQKYLSHFAPTPRAKYPEGFLGDPPFLLERDTPVEAAEYLRKNPPKGRLWTNMVFGSYLTWAGFPDALPHADPRVELYPVAFWKEYARVQSGSPQAEEILKTSGFTCVLLHEEQDEGLLKRLTEAGWAVLLHDREVLLLISSE